MMESHTAIKTSGKIINKMVINYKVFRSNNKKHIKHTGKLKNGYIYVRWKETFFIAPKCW